MLSPEHHFFLIVDLQGHFHKNGDKILAISCVTPFTSLFLPNGEHMRKITLHKAILKILTNSEESQFVKLSGESITQFIF